MAVSGREIDWDAVVREYTPRIRRLVARRVADAATVEDVVQETFIQAYRNWSSFDLTQPLWPWPATIAANLCWRLWQAEQRWGDADAFRQVPLPDYFGQAGSDEHVARLDRAAAVHRALQRMTSRHRRILYRWELERTSTAALAATEEVSPEVLKATAVRARRNFRQYFLASGEGPFAGVLLGLTGLLNRWREKATRVATSGSWVEATGTLVAAPVVAVAGMAMLAVAPTSTVEPRPAASATAQPVVAVQDAAPAVPSPGGPPAAAAASAQARPVTPSPTPASPAASGLPIRAAAQPTLTTTTNRQSSEVTQADPAGDSRYHGGIEWNCETKVGKAACAVFDALPSGTD